MPIKRFPIEASHIMMFARSIGDDNQIYYDADYAKTTEPKAVIAPPTFVFFTNIATTFHFSYERFLVNKLRESFGYAGTPVRIQVRARARKRKT